MPEKEVPFWRRRCRKNGSFWGWDKPLWYQFGAWIWDIVRGDFGVSMWTGRPVLYEISIRFQLSLQVGHHGYFPGRSFSHPPGHGGRSQAGHLD